MLRDKELSVNEPFNETAFGVGLFIPGKHFLIFEFRSVSALYHRVASQQLYVHPLVTYV